jgi:hypothetical protein
MKLSNLPPVTDRMIEEQAGGIPEEGGGRGRRFEFSKGQKCQTVLGRADGLAFSRCQEDGTILHQKRWWCEGHYRQMITRRAAARPPRWEREGD